MGFEVEIGRHKSCNLDLLQMAVDAVLGAKFLWHGTCKLGLLEWQ